MAKDPLSSLEKVDLRTYWQNEARDFTPWLAEYIHLLGEAIGFELDLATTNNRNGVTWFSITKVSTIKWSSLTNLLMKKSA